MRERGREGGREEGGRQTHLQTPDRKDELLLITVYLAFSTMPDIEGMLNNYLLNEHINEWIDVKEHGRHRKFFKTGKLY